MFVMGAILGMLIGVGVIILLMFKDSIFDARKIYQFQLKNKKSLAEKIGLLMQKDLSADCARAVFYIDNDYNQEMTQAEWKKYCQEKVQQFPDKDSQEYAEAVAPIVNAIVINDGVYVRRGMEYLGGTYERFMPGVNDRISLNYFVEPYEYRKNEALAAKSLKEESLRRQEYEKNAPQREAAYAERKKAEAQEAEERIKRIRADYAASRRCSNCVHGGSCPSSVKIQTGSCGGYTPK